jgi:hypothetical protein
MAVGVMNLCAVRNGSEASILNRKYIRKLEAA